MLQRNIQCYYWHRTSGKLQMKVNVREIVCVRVEFVPYSKVKAIFYFQVTDEFNSFFRCKGVEKRKNEKRGTRKEKRKRRIWEKKKSNWSDEEKWRVTSCSVFIRKRDHPPYSPLIIPLPKMYFNLSSLISFFLLTYVCV